jgi:HAD superfamily hydrolase (TIGR01549 family)
VRLQGILFDYGGTLDGPASHWLDRMVELYRAAGVDQSFERIKAAFYRADAAAYADPRVAGMSLAELMSFHVGAQLEALELHDAALRRQVAAAFVARSEAALADSRSVLAQLARRYRLGVVSNFYGNVARILAEAEILPLLTVVADSNRVGWMKPDRRIFDHALRALGTPPQSTLHVGDSYERDVQAAGALGLRTAWLVAADRRPAAPDPVAQLVISSLDELVALLELPPAESTMARP